MDDALSKVINALKQRKVSFNAADYPDFPAVVEIIEHLQVKGVVQILDRRIDFLLVRLTDDGREWLAARP